MSPADRHDSSPRRGRGRERGPGEGAELAPLFAALGDGTRLALLVTLCSSGPLSITQIGQHVDVSRQAVTKHLDVLADAGLVTSRRAGRERIWEFEPRRFDDAQQFLEQISKRWDDALGRLKAFVEG